MPSTEIVKSDSEKDGATDIWGALVEAAPALAVKSPYLNPLWAAHPGFKDWLITEYALGVPSNLIRDKLASIVSDQLDEGLSPWPLRHKHDIEEYRRELRPEWYPVSVRIRDRIANVGVLDKNQRLLKMLTLAEQLESKVWDERNEKTGELYLITELRNLYRQIAEEKGELGEVADNAVGMLGEIGKILAGAVSIQGSGMRPAEEPPVEVYFREVESD